MGLDMIGMGKKDNIHKYNKTCQEMSCWVTIWLIAQVVDSTESLVTWIRKWISDYTYILRLIGIDYNS